MFKKILYFQYLFLVLAKGYAQENPIALIGATVIDVSNFGNRSNDIPNATERNLNFIAFIIIFLNH